MNELVFIQNEQPITTSLKVAEKFEKNHQHVMRDIRDLEKQLDVSRFGQMFSAAEYADKYGRPQPMYLMNFNGFTLLTMGFTGEKALKFKLDYIDAFDAMKNKLIELLAERKSAEWLEIRRAGVKTNKKMTAAIQQDLIPLAREQGSTTDDKFFYINYQRAVNKAAGINPKSRDELSISQLYEVDKLQDIATCSIKGRAAKNEPYKQIYSGTKQMLEDYAQISLISQRFLN